MSDFIDQFHRHYYDSLVWQNTKWLGVQILKMTKAGINFS